MRVAITHGDTNGVGYEMILKAFEDPTMFELCTPIVYGSSKVANYHANVLRTETPFFIINQPSEAQPNKLNLLNCCGNEEINVELGTPTQESGAAAMKALNRAIADFKEGKFDVLVTTPVNRSTMRGFQGHTDYLEHQFEGAGKGISILVSDDIRVALVTNNVAIKDLPEAITRQKIVEKGKLFYHALRRDLGVQNPRIAVLSLNPRCGEDGRLGDEEQDTIIPAVKDLEEAGIQAFGPYAADNFFGRGEQYRFDGILAMYHDQGLLPFKSLNIYEGVRFSAGLPIIRTAPATDPKFSVAGQQVTTPDSLRHSIFLAIDVLRNRQTYDEPMGNPLPKLYHEKRDDSEKVRFRSSDSRTPGSNKPNREPNPEHDKD
jgi:4-hydroxythreonine-4-phosphate dehydrogenase